MAYTPAGEMSACVFELWSRLLTLVLAKRLKTQRKSARTSEILKQCLGYNFMVVRNNTNITRQQTARLSPVKKKK